MDPVRVKARARRSWGANRGAHHWHRAPGGTRPREANNEKKISKAQTVIKITGDKLAPGGMAGERAVFAEHWRRALIVGRGINPGGSVNVFGEPTTDVQRRRWPPPGVTLSRCRLLDSID